MPRKTYVNRTTKEILREVDDHRDVNFPASDWSRDPTGLDALVTAGVLPRYWVFDPPGSDALREMTPAEKTTVDTNATALDNARTQRRAELLAELTIFLESRYSAQLRLALTALRPGASGGMATLLDNFIVWHRRAWSAYRNALNSIAAATTIPAVEGTTLPFAALVTQDPGVAIDQTAP
jgi:hypothetical protein